MSNGAFLVMLAVITIVNLAMMVTAPHPIIYIMGGFGATLGVVFLIGFIWILARA